MPTVRVTVPEDDLEDEEKAELIDRLTGEVADFYLEVQGEDIEQFVNVQILETTEQGYAVGGEIIG